MSNLPAKFQGAELPATPADAAAMLQNAVKNAPKVATGKQYINLGQVGSQFEGLYTYGVQHEEPHEDSRWVINITSAKHGWCLRLGKNVSKKQMTTIFEEIEQSAPMASRDDPEDAKYKLFYEIELACTESPHSDRKVTWLCTTMTTGGSSRRCRQSLSLRWPRESARRASLRIRS